MSDYIKRDPKRVANLLKKMVNENCEEGFKWYEDVGEMPTVLDVNYAIELLEKARSQSMTIIDEEEQEHECE